MILKNGEVTAAKIALAKILNLKMPVKSSLQVARMDIKLNDAIEAFVKVRDGLFAEYEIVHKDDKFTSDTPEKAQAFADKFNELLQEEVEVDIEPIDLPEIEIEPSVLQAMNKLIK